MKVALAAAAGFLAGVLLVIDHGGRVFGVVVEHNWQVTAQTPDAGIKLEQGSTVHVDIDRR